MFSSINNTLLRYVFDRTYTYFGKLAGWGKLGNGSWVGGSYGIRIIGDGV